MRHTVPLPLGTPKWSPGCYRNGRFSQPRPSMVRKSISKHALSVTRLFTISQVIRWALLACHISSRLTSMSDTYCGAKQYHLTICFFSKLWDGQPHICRGTYSGADSRLCCDAQLWHNTAHSVGYLLFSLRHLHWNGSH